MRSPEQHRSRRRPDLRLDGLQGSRSLSGTRSGAQRCTSGTRPLSFSCSFPLPVSTPGLTPAGSDAALTAVQKAALPNYWVHKAGSLISAHTHTNVDTQQRHNANTTSAAPLCQWVSCDIFDWQGWAGTSGGSSGLGLRAPQPKMDVDTQHHATKRKLPPRCWVGRIV